MEELARGLYQRNPLLNFIGLLVTTLVLHMLAGTTFFMQIPESRALVLFLTILLSGLSFIAGKLTQAITEAHDLEIPTVVLWLYPLLLMGLTYSLFLLLLVGVPAWTHRGIWSDTVGLNAKTTTALFSWSLISFKVFIGMTVIGALFQYLRWWLGIFQDPVSLREKLNDLTVKRQKGTRFNRYAFFTALGLMVTLGLWITFLRPEMILYYRGELQLRTGQHHEIALETFQHLIRKYPDYAYLDTVEFRAAWTLSRFLRRYSEAVTAFSAFLGKYGTTNAWADEALVNLISLTLEHQNNPAESLTWIKQFRTHFPHGHMLMHVILYEIKALLRQGKKAEAATVLEDARRQFQGRHLVLYNNEDDVRERLPFESVLAAINLEGKGE
jgi:hypothetical protein